MVTFENEYFSLRSIAESGQCFRMTQVQPSEPSDWEFWQIPSGDRLIYAAQRGDVLRFYCSESEWQEYWAHYFDMDTDYKQIIDGIPVEDTYLRQAAWAGRGIRILNQNLWEVLISFIASQQNNIPRIRGILERLCENFGTPLTAPEIPNELANVLAWSSMNESGQLTTSKIIESLPNVPVCCFSFPPAGRMALLSRENLAVCHMGYRDKYMLAAAQSVAAAQYTAAQNTVPAAATVMAAEKQTTEKKTAAGKNMNAASTSAFSLEKLSGFARTKEGYQAARRYLLTLYGVGPKVADCICLFGLHNLAVCPVDTHMHQIFLREYGKDVPVGGDAAGCGVFAPDQEKYAGILQQYLFYFELGK